MPIDELPREDCQVFLGRVALARLACAMEDQPYAVPIYFAYEPDFIYVLSTAGQKIEWMRANPKVCVLADEILDESHWTSVVVNGVYQELPEPQFRDERKRARQLLQQRHRWWINALGERQAKSGDTLIEPLFFRIEVISMSGLRAGV
jgi:hypothetical protein